MKPPKKKTRTQLTAALWLQLQPGIKRALAAKLHVHEAPEDLVQDVALVVARKLGSFEGRNGASLATWVHAIAERVAVRELRRRTTDRVRAASGYRRTAKRKRPNAEPTPPAFKRKPGPAPHPEYSSVLANSALHAEAESYPQAFESDAWERDSEGAIACSLFDEDAAYDVAAPRHQPRGDSGFGTPLGVIPKASATPEELYADCERTALVQRTLAELPGELREFAELRAKELTTSAAGEKLGLSQYERERAAAALAAELAARLAASDGRQAARRGQGGAGSECGGGPGKRTPTSTGASRSRRAPSRRPRSPKPARSSDASCAPSPTEPHASTASPRPRRAR